MAGGIRAVLDVLVQLPADDRAAVLRGAADAAEGVAAMRHVQGDPAGEQDALEAMTRLRRLADEASPFAERGAAGARQNGAQS